MKRNILSLVVVASAMTASSVASAELKSWTALKANVPTNTEVLVGFDVKAVRGASSYAKGFELAMKSSSDVAVAVGVIKSTCSIDVQNVVSDFAVAIKTKGPDEFTIAIGLDGIDEAKALDCANKIAKLGSAKAKITSSKSGKVTDYAVDEGNGGKQHHIYAVWAAKDVVVFSTDAEDKAKLDPYLNGKAPQGDLATYLGKASQSGVGWLAASVGEDHVKGVYGQGTYAKSTFNGDIHVIAESAADATKMAKEANADLDKAKSKAPADLKKILSSVKVVANGSEVTLTGTVAEADIPNAVMALLKM